MPSFGRPLTGFCICSPLPSAHHRNKLGREQRRERRGVEGEEGGEREYLFIFNSGPIAGHVMLSYNWGSQPIVIRIAKSLKDLGYKVWLDTEQMKGDTLEASITSSPSLSPRPFLSLPNSLFPPASCLFYLPLLLPYIFFDICYVANAIEQADMVLICMTQKYKDSANCRLEGEYCMNRKVEFVPLMMQQGYRPDGW